MLAVFWNEWIEFTCAVNALIAPYFIAYEKQRFVLLLGELSSLTCVAQLRKRLWNRVGFGTFYNSGNLVQQLQCLLGACFHL